MVGLDKDDYEKRLERMQPVLKDLQKRGADPDMQTNPVARMRSIVNHLKAFVSMSLMLLSIG